MLAAVYKLRRLTSSLFLITIVFFQNDLPPHIGWSQGSGAVHDCACVGFICALGDGGERG